MADDPREIAFDPRAPAGEQHDAQHELAKAARPTASSLIPSAEVSRMIAWINDDLAEQDMLKASSGQVVQFPGRGRPVPKAGMRSVYVDDLQIFASGAIYEKPGPVGFEALRTMFEQTPILSAILLTRQRQIARFCQPSEDGGMGFAIRHMDPEKKLAGAERDAATLLTQFFQHNGWEFNPRKRKQLKRASFSQAMAKAVRDTLSMDALAIETEMKRDRSLGMDGFYVLDGSTIRLCTEDGYEGDDEIYALQVLQGRIATSYTLDQLIYEPRNPRSDVTLAGYGLPETELLIRTVTGFLNAMTYNIAGFDNNSIPKGLLHLSGDYDSGDLSAFRRYWNAMVKGVNNAWTLPVMVSKDGDSKASFEKFGVEFNEMYFAKWMTFLVSIMCAIYGMSPDEINFESFSAQRSSMAGSDTEEKLADSKDKGLRPLLSYFEALFTDFIVADFDPKLCFRWVGLESKDPQVEWEADKLTLTVDELRKRRGDAPFPDKLLGSAPLNPALMGAWQQQAMPPQQPEQPAGPDFGEVPGGGGSGPGPAPGDPAAQDGAQDSAQPGDQGQQAQQKPKGDEFGQADQGDFGKSLPTIYSL